MRLECFQTFLALLIFCLPLATYAQKSREGASSEIIGKIKILSDGRGALIIDGKEARVRKFYFNFGTTTLPVSPNGRWLAASRSSNSDFWSAGAFDLTLGSEAFETEAGFLGYFNLERVDQFADNWAKEMSDEHRRVYEMALLDELTMDGGLAQDSKSAEDLLHKLRRSNAPEDQETLRNLESGASETMELNFGEKSHRVYRRFAGWVDGDTAVYWDTFEFEHSETPEMTVMLVDFANKTITVPWRTLADRKEIASLSDEARSRLIRIGYADFGSENNKPNPLVEFEVQVSDAEFPPEARELIRADMRWMVKELPEPKKEKLLKAVENLRKEVPAKFLPF